MSFLPFVLSFLLILVLGSSMLMTSFRSTTREKTVILAQKNARLMLIGELAIKESKPPRKEGQGGSKSETKERSAYEEKRSVRTSMLDTKFNLWPLLQKKDPLAVKILHEKAVKLIENLYKKANFYQAAHDPQLAQQIVDQMVGKEATSLLELFPEDPKLAAIYYKMIKGTNTGYPALGEYFKIDSKKEKIQFRYASTEVLRAVLGDDLTSRVLAAERAKWDANEDRILKKEELHQLAGKYGFDVNHLDLIFTFSLDKDGTPHAYVDKDLKVMAIR